MMSLNLRYKSSLVILASLFIFGCQGGEDQTNIELIQDMMEGPQINAQEGTREGKMLNRLPPSKSISRNFKPYPFDKADVKSAESLMSPKSTLTKEELLAYEKVGKTKFEIYCGICHGNEGLGDGSIASKMLKRPPSLVSDTYKSYSDGRLFHVVTNGWGLMGGYASQVPLEEERWAIVDHLRKLQKKSGTKSNKDKENETTENSEETEEEK